MKKTGYILITGIIFLLSFRLYSALFYPALNSDNAVGILMVHYFHLPHDWYAWGQDRMGSLIPLLAQIPHRLFHWSALTSESVIHYGILLLGFLAFASFLKSKFYRVVFAIVWFFPPMRLIDVTQFAFGIQYSLIAMACYLLSRSDKASVRGKPVVYHLILLATVLVLISAVWVSDLAVVSVVLLLGIRLFFLVKENGPQSPVLRNSGIYYAVATIVAGGWFILYAKANAGAGHNYAAIDSLHTFGRALGIFTKTVVDLFLFRANEPFTSVYSWLVLLILGFAVSRIRKMEWNDTIRKWGIFFLLDAVVVFAVIMLSRWTFLNNVPRRYFTCTYISLSFVVLLVFDNGHLRGKQLKMWQAFIALTVVIGGAGTIYNLKYIWPGTLTPKVKVVGEFKQLGKIGVIAEYWNSYITSCVDPEMIKATPHDTTWAVKSREQVKEVFEQKNIYVIRDMWLKSFPDTLKEFGHTLLKDGEPFHIGDCDVCKYAKTE
ncbi:hypothetical protein PbJCM13498_16730 [Prolixibacter bellariivorans]|uniref:Glycosyltransferase RgtA/B/C/D-like domain-containing protein n=1 Tax=Prolixibacter bellariivorans TaxID=314319 RepID=A0A5M4AY31_9BACT|nr:hypothetical protein [Prolixibacter bellariivorans]GET32810.1 hypothetical protein PbJCM13498_16730 [Prolixibacter bellariivorans]